MIKEALAVGAFMLPAGAAAPAVAAEQHRAVPEGNQQAHVGEQAGPLAVAASAENLTVLAASSSREGTDGNNIVCGGVPTKAKLMFYAKGGKDKCGHSDIDEAWAKIGVTPQVASTMKSGTICTSDNVTSEGRHHSPKPSMDHKTKLSTGTSIFTRGLEAFGPGCYPAWVGYRENGDKVGVLKGCGNGEGEIVTEQKSPPAPKGKAKVEVFKIALDAEGHQLPSLPTSTFHFAATCVLKGKTKREKDVAVNTAPQGVINCDPSTATKKRYVTVTELPTTGNETWTTLSQVTQKLVIPRDPKGRKGPKTVRFTYKDQEKAPTPVVTTTPVCAPPTTGTYPDCKTPPTAITEIPKFPPTVTVDQKTPEFEGLYTDQEIDICGPAHSNPLSNGVVVTWNAVYGRTSPTFMRDGEFCTTYNSPATPVTDENVTETAEDKVNHLTASDSTGKFPARQRP